MQTVDLTSLDLKDGMRLLDLGCGAGRHLHRAYYAAEIEAVGVDLSFDDLSKTRSGFEAYPDTKPGAVRRFRLAAADATQLPFPDGSFDIVICSEVLEHIPDYQGAIREAARVLKAGGRLAVSVPRFWPEWICWRLAKGYHNTPGGHIRIFQPGDLKAAISAAGFRFTRRHFAHGLHAPYWWLKCLLWERRESFWLIRLYHRFLVWDIMKRPLLTRLLERLADPLMGKSVVFYFRKEAPQ